MRPRQWARALLLLAVALAVLLAEAVPVVAADPETDGGAWRWPAAGRISQSYGCTGAWTNGRVGRCRHFHNGMDIANRAGTPIRAARSGFVAYVGWSPYERRDRAWIVIINHGGGLRTWYAHMLPRRVRGAGRGDHVAAGELIGYMGATGRATGVHLHFGVQKGNRFVNPKSYLRGLPDRGSKQSSGAMVGALAGFAPGGPRVALYWARPRVV